MKKSIEISPNIETLFGTRDENVRLLEGLDDIGMTLKHTDEIVAWETRMKASQPWLQEVRDSRQ